MPRIESAVRENTLYVKADLPGIDPKDVEVMVEGNRLTLRGERKAEHEGAERWLCPPRSPVRQLRAELHHPGRGEG